MPKVKLGRHPRYDFYMEQLKERSTGGFMNATEFGKYIGVRYDVARKMLEEVPHQKLGRQYRYPLPELADFLAREEET